MQAYKGYYTNGYFVPLDIGDLPEGTQAIITLLEDPPKDISKRLKDFDEIVKAIREASEEEMPEIERVNLNRDSL